MGSIPIFSTTAKMTVSKMTVSKPVQQFKDNLWYPILVPMGGYNRIVEMLGKNINEHNNRVECSCNRGYNNIFKGRHSD